MKGMLHLAVAAFMLCSVITAIAQPTEVVAPKTETVAQTLVAPEKVISKQDSELLLVKEQNRMIKEFQSSQQATVYWALGSILGFVVILTGLSIFTNFKLYDQDKERLRNEFETKIAAYRSEFNLQIEEYKREADQSADQKNQIIQDRFLNQTAELRTSLENLRSELISNIKTTDDNLKILVGDVSKTTRNLSEAESALRSVEVMVWELRKIPGNMLITHTQALDAAVKSEKVYLVSHVLDQILNTLQKQYQEPGNAVGNVQYKFLTSSLDNADALDSVGVSKVRQKLAELIIMPDTGA